LALTWLDFPEDVGRCLESLGGMLVLNFSICFRRQADLVKLVAGFRNPLARPTK